MTVTNARLRDALAQWPLDREQRSLIDKALAGIDVDRTDQIVELLRTAQNSLIDFDFASSIADAPFESTSGFEA
ncbi:MAG TPA: hypothetical protein VMM15_41685, partial [Bradyrhizobium sp.]|nr:hypothetical protein [Bradyrhizobium sp.]